MEFPRSNFTYTIQEKSRLVIIIDQWTSSVSVPPLRTLTNDIENVVEFIANQAKISIYDYIWVYRDTADQWTGWSPIEGFYHITIPEEMAVSLLILNSPEVQSRLKQLPNEL